MVAVIKEIREQAPGTGAYKLFLMLKSTFADKMVGRDKFYKLMRTHQLMLPSMRRRHTTNSNHNYRKYKNLVKEFVPTAPNQLWVADITYVDTDEGVCYLHLITDAFTHEIIGWVVSDTLLAINTQEALEQAICQADAESLLYLIHHSDRGSQYCCNAYVNRLKEIGARISMTEDYKPTDNAIAERVNGIIKQEWLYRMKRPKNLVALKNIMKGIVKFYNEERLHYSNGMLTPKAMREKHSLEASRLQP